MGCPQCHNCCGTVRPIHVLLCPSSCLRQHLHPSWTLGTAVLWDTGCEGFGSIGLPSSMFHNPKVLWLKRKKLPISAIHFLEHLCPVTCCSFFSFTEIEFAKNIMKIAETGRNAVYSQVMFSEHFLLWVHFLVGVESFWCELLFALLCLISAFVNLFQSEPRTVSWMNAPQMYVKTRIPVYSIKYYPKAVASFCCLSCSHMPALRNDTFESALCVRWNWLPCALETSWSQMVQQKYMK